MPHAVPRAPRGDKLWANYTDYNPFVPAQWSINPKVSKELADSPFNGDLHMYKDWHDLVRDHLLSANQGWGRVVYEIEREPSPLTMARIEQQPWINGMTCDLMWLTRTLWTFLVRNMNKSFRRTVRSLPCMP